MTDATMALMTVSIPDGKPGIAQAAEALGVDPAAIDAEYGVVPIDPDQHLYAVQVRKDALPKVKLQNREFRGPFANPRIEPFGPRRR